MELQSRAAAQASMESQHPRMGTFPGRSTAGIDALSYRDQPAAVGSMWQTFTEMRAVGALPPEGARGLQDLHYQSMRNRGKALDAAAKLATAVAGPTYQRASSGEARDRRCGADVPAGHTRF